MVFLEDGQLVVTDVQVRQVKKVDEGVGMDSLETVSPEVELFKIGNTVQVILGHDSDPVL